MPKQKKKALPWGSAFKGGRDGIEPGGDTLNRHSPSPRKEIVIGSVGPGRFLPAAGEPSAEGFRKGYRPDPDWPIVAAEPVTRTPLAPSSR